MKQLFLIRGIPGSGKTTFAREITDVVFSADDFFVNPVSGDYEFDASLLYKAHRSCQNKTECRMKTGEDMAVANTFTTVKEMKEYYKLAEQYGYTVFSVIVENRHGGKDVHNVPEDTLTAMRERFVVKL